MQTSTLFDIRREHLLRMGGRIIRIALFWMAINWLAEAWLHPTSTIPFYVRAYKFWKLDRCPDIIFIGSSATRENVDDARVSTLLQSPAGAPTAFKLAITGGGPEVTYAILQGVALERIKSGNFGTPKLWVVEIHPFEISPRFNNKATRKKLETETISWMANYDRLDSLPEFLLEIVKNGIGPYPRIMLENLIFDLTDRFAVFRLNRDWADVERLRRLVRAQLARVGIGRSSGQLRAHTAIDDMSTLTKNYQIDPKALELFLKTILAIQERGEKVVAITFPFNPSYGALSPIESEFKKAMGEIAERARIPYHHFTLDECRLTDPDFFDHVHIMRQAMPKVTDAVVELALRPNLPAVP